MSLLNNTHKEELFLPKKLSKISLFLDDLIATRTYKLSAPIVDTTKTMSIQLSSKNKHKFENIEKVMHLSLWEGIAILKLSHWPMLEELQAYISEKELEELPEDVALVTLSTVFNPLIKTLSKKLSTTIELIKFPLCNKDNREDMADDLRGEVFSINFNLEIEDKLKIRATLLFDQKIIRHILSIINKISSIPNITAVDISTPVYLECGASYLSNAVMSSIEQGDILMIDFLVDYTKNYLKLRFISKQIFLAKKQDESQTYELLEEVKMEENKLEQDIIPLKDIPLLITFDLGKVSTSLEKIEKLGVGYTLDIQKEFTDLVTLRIDNQAIGKGELVNIGDRVGVRITELNPKK